MTYIYDVLLNFTEQNNPIEFFEWNKDDTLEHIKRIPLIKVSSKTLNDFTKYNIQVDKSLLDRIKEITIMYRKTKDLDYALLLSDTNRVVAFEFNKKGEIISRSSLLLDEEEEIIEESYDEKEEQLLYKKINKLSQENFLTRTEKNHQNYLLKEIDFLYKEKYKEKLQYLYEEIYSKDNLTIEEKYLKLKQDLLQKYTNKFEQLYKIVRLTYIKK
ncbi:MAG: hypothetical protein IJE53_07330 [Bacilli bacterium]|nr:hypothetical protein [Bacilli bacterium]